MSSYDAIRSLVPREVIEKSERVYIYFQGGLGVSDKMYLIKDRLGTIPADELIEVIPDEDAAVAVKVWLKETSVPIVHDAVSTYQKGDFFCIKTSIGHYVKYPIANIWRIEEV